MRSAVVDKIGALADASVTDFYAHQFSRGRRRVGPIGFL